MEQFTVLMSVYGKEKSEYLDMALESVYNNTYLPDEILLIEDGPLTKELYKIIDKYKKNNNFKIIKLKNNVGLGKALDVGVKQSKNNIIIRMDSDDVSYDNRFEKQIKFLRENPEIKILGTNSIEFIKQIGDCKIYRKYPEKCNEIKKFSKRRCPFLHPTIAFYKDIVEEVGGYKDLPFFEDYYLFLRIIKKYRGWNLQEPLLYFRSNNETFKRRGGISYIVKEYTALSIFYKENLINLRYFISNFILRFFVRIVGNGLRSKIYKIFLRKKV